MGNERNWDIITYLTEEQLLSVLTDKESQISAFAYILHDKDVKSDGTLKEPHFHLCLLLNNGHTFSQMEKWFSGFLDDKGKPVNTLLEKLKSPLGAFQYLTHNTEDSKNKYQYNTEDIVSVNTERFLKKHEKQDTILLAIQDLLAGVPLREVSQKYGRDFIVHYGHIKTLYNDIIAQDFE